MRPTDVKAAPIFTAAWDLNVWIQRRLGKNDNVLADTLARTGLALLDAVTLALKDIDRHDYLHQADLHLIRLRTAIRLAWEIDLVQEHQALYVLGLADDIGRQIGGWQKRLAGAS